MVVVTLDSDVAISGFVGFPQGKVAIVRCTRKKSAQCHRKRFAISMFTVFRISLSVNRLWEERNQSPSGPSLGKSQRFYVLQLLTRKHRLHTIRLIYCKFSYFLAMRDFTQTPEENQIFTSVLS